MSDRILPLVRGRAAEGGRGSMSRTFCAKPIRVIGGYSARLFVGEAVLQARTIFSRPTVTFLVAFRVSTTSEALATIHW